MNGWKQEIICDAHEYSLVWTISMEQQMQF